MDIILKHLPIKMKFEVGINDTNSRVINGGVTKGYIMITKSYKFTLPDIKKPSCKSWVLE